MVDALNWVRPVHTPHSNPRARTSGPPSARVDDAATQGGSRSFDTSDTGGSNSDGKKRRSSNSKGKRRAHRLGGGAGMAAAGAASFSSFSSTAASSSTANPTAQTLGLLGRSRRLVRRLSRPFGRVHHIVGEEEEMRRHPSLADRAPTGACMRGCNLVGCVLGGVGFWGGRRVC